MSNELIKPYISITQVNMYLRCGESYRRRYIENEKIPPAIALLKGSAFHTGAEINFKQKIETKKDLPVKDIIDISVNAVEERIEKEGVSLNEEEESIGKEKVIGMAKDGAARISELAADRVFPRYQPVSVEDEQKILLPSASHDLKGIIDLIDDRETIIDFKTSSRTMRQEDVDRSGQLTFYSMLYKAKNKKNPKSLTIENLVDKKKPEAVSLSTMRDETDYQVMINRINTVLDGIKKGSFPPAAEGSWICSARFCGYWNNCPLINHSKK